LLLTMTNTALKIGETSKPIINPYKKYVNVPKVSLSPTETGFYVTKHKSWLAESGQRQPPPTQEVCFGKKAGELDDGISNEKRTNLHETEVIHGDHGVFLCKNRDSLFLIVPVQDEWGVPDIEATLTDAASVPDCEVTSTQNVKRPKSQPTIQEQITTQAEKITDGKGKKTQDEDPQWIKSVYKNIPTMNEISELLCKETDAICFLANRGVIDPCGICSKCRGE